ncbi:MAG: 3-methylcrotonyl-CoA carboxylase, partial [Candidatus Eisenbacteria bacterium]
QVEHPVTEMVTGLDLVRLQVEVAAGGRLPVTQQQVTRRGHAIEARVYAEDAARNFLPQAGRATRVRWPRAPFVRVDAGVVAGDAVPVHYDPILCKVIAFGEDRPRALGRLARALDESVVQGVVSNLPFLRALVRARPVERAECDTEWIEREFLSSFAGVVMAPVPELALAAAAVAESLGLTRDGVAPSPVTATGAGVGGAAEHDPFAAFGSWRQKGLDRHAQ